MNKSVKGVQTFIRNYIKDTRNAWIAKNTKAMDKNWNKYFADKNVLMIRPSGNPMTVNDEHNMITCKDVNIKSGTLKSIDTIRVFADDKAAVVTLTCHDQFEYKGTHNDDMAKFSVVLEKIDGEWKVVHGHRATGQKPTQ